MKRNYRSSLLQKRIEEGNDLKTFWSGFTILDAIYEIHSAWEKTKPLTIKRSWKKLMPDISEEDEFLGFNEDAIVNRITEEVQTVPGGEDVDNDNIRQWLHCDMDDHGYELLTDQGIVDRLRGVGGDGGESDSDEEGETADRATARAQPSVTHGAALANVEMLLDYLENQDDALATDKIVLRNLRSKIKKKCFSAQKQKTVMSYFQKK